MVQVDATDNEHNTSRIWGGRFAAGPDAVLEAINASIDFDQRLWPQDIRGSIAHASMLARAGILNEEDLRAIIGGLEAIAQDLSKGEFAFSRALEDIHMNIEARLAQDIGEAAGRLHTARSRNDQVATDLRLWVRDRIDEQTALLTHLMGLLLKRAEEHVDTVMPGFTHLQTAMPVTFGHHLLAYLEMFSRDRARMRDARDRLNECPLGAAALAGTSFPIDRDYTAELLGFDAPMRNSLDAVSDRDFALEYISAASITGIHCSRLAEEMVLWSSSGFDFIRLSDHFTTGSSIMPQKKNPDAAELVRAKLGRIAGHFQGLMMVMKGLPLAYSKDMQEDKEAVFDAADSLELMLRAMAGMIGDMQANPDAMARAAAHGHSTATELADWLVRDLGLPFREAHHVTGSLVKMADEQQCQLADLTLADMQRIHPHIHAKVYDVLPVQEAIKARNSYGGTAPERVLEMIQWWKEELA